MLVPPAIWKGERGSGFECAIACLPRAVAIFLEVRTLEERLVREIEAVAREGTLPCPIALGTAKRLGVDSQEIGRKANEMEVRITHCQLGLFGHSSRGKGRIVRPASQVPEELAQKINLLIVEGRMPCASAFALAREEGMGRLEVSNALEALGVKVSQCQLGCFP